MRIEGALHLRIKEGGDMYFRIQSERRKEKFENCRVRVSKMLKEEFHRYGRKALRIIFLCDYLLINFAINLLIIFLF